MRDNTAQNDLADVVLPPDPAGLRHSIRPIRSAAEQQEASDDNMTGSKVFAIKRRTSQRITPPKPRIEAPIEAEVLSNPVYTLKRPEPIYAPVEETTAAPVLKVAPSYAPPSLTIPDLPRWHELTKIRTGSRLGKGPALPVVDSERESTSARAFDLLRTRLRQTTQERGWTNIAIAAPTSGCGNTFTAVNLALSMSRVTGSRTVLMDFNLRKPGVAPALDIRPRGSMADFLHGRSPISDHMIRVSDTLALGLNNRADENAAETLQAAETGNTLERMRTALKPELVLYDMPAMLAHDDVTAFLPHLDAVLLVSDGTRTMSRELMECERLLEGQVPLLGVVLNRARANSIKQYA